MTEPPVPVLEIGGTHVTAAAVDVASLTATSRRRYPLDPDAAAGPLLDALADAARGVPDTAGRRWGVAIPGPFDYDRGIGRFEGVAKFAALDGVDVRSGLATRLGIDPGAFVFVNDADAFAMGEWAASDEHEARAVFLTLGTGVGSGFLADGKPVADAPGIPPGGRAHLLQYDGAPLEDSVSRRAIMRAYRVCSAVETDVRQIAELARAGDACAARIFATAMVALGRSLAPPVAAFGATAIVVGGSMAASWDLIAGPFAAGLYEVRPALRGHVSIRAAEVEDAGVLGAALATRGVGQDR